MSPQRLTLSDSSDEEAPEALSFGSSKKAAKAAQNELLTFQVAEKLKRKEKNREKDRLQKERAAQTKLKGKGKQVERPKKTSLVASDEEEGAEGGEQDDLEARMERAMRDAENEEEEEEDADMMSFERMHQFGEAGSGTWQQQEDDDEEGEMDEDDADEDEEDEEDEDMEDVGDDDEDISEEDEGEDALQLEDKPNSKYLSDSLFESAFAQANVAKSSKPKAAKSLKKNAKNAKLSSSNKRKRVKRGPKDIVIGCDTNLAMWKSPLMNLLHIHRSRTIRTLEPTKANEAVASRTMVPPGRVNKFINRSLKLKGKPSAKKTHGWERKPGKAYLPLSYI